jgi:cellulose biosynthesis protein BcsQ
MLKALERIRSLRINLAESKAIGDIKDFRIKLHVNSEITVYLLYENSKPVLTGLWPDDEKIHIKWLTNTDLEEDNFYNSLFTETEDTVDLGSRRRFANLIDIEPKEKIKSCPIINFYSYKGGVGRSTTLALFASYYAMQHGKKVVIIDCDFEAPGFNNFFGLDYEETAKNGIVELILDSQFSETKPELRQCYSIEVSKEYSGDGSIYIIPAGNLSTHENLVDYLEALARLDINSTPVIKGQFKHVIEYINEEFTPDIILMDNRTGFNDVFGVLGFLFSTIVVGFFANNRQTKPGLHFFLDSLYNAKVDTGIILVNSILPNKISSRVNDFKLEIENYLKEADSERIDAPIFDAFGIGRNSSLEDIGASKEDLSIFKEFVKEDIKRDANYMELFEKMTELISAYEAKNIRNEKPQMPPKQTTTQKETNELKMEVIKNLENNFPEAYGEEIEVNETFLNSIFYFRKCMEDIFNFNKFLLLGGKGTGKTVFYKALKNELFFTTLQKRARKEDLSFIVTNINSLQNEPNECKFLEMHLCSDEESKTISETFYKRFWIIYIWNSLMMDKAKTGFTSSLEVRPIRNDAETALRFLNIIHDTQKFIQVEAELKSLDNFLKEQKKYLIIVFDQLDHIVKPNQWSEGIAPLINYWRNPQFNRIFGKLLMRRDLFNKMGNLTNKELLSNQAINLEWSPEEIFAFFFKPIFYYSSGAFLQLMRIINLDIPEETIKTIQDFIESPVNFQLPADRKFLMPIVNTFFGKYAHPENLKYGQSYNWLYQNLKNADDTISLRPFIDLIKYAVNKAIRAENPFPDKASILSPSFYTHPEGRVNAVKRHFEDLASEKGNEDFKYIIEFIRNDQNIPLDLKRTTLFQFKFEKLLKYIIEHNPQLQTKDIDELTKMLISNGVIMKRFDSGGIKKYSFAYLYKYFLGLKDNLAVPPPRGAGSYCRTPFNNYK